MYTKPISGAEFSEFSAIETKLVKQDVEVQDRDEIETFQLKYRLETVSRPRL